MLSREDNELLCRVGPGTPVGAMLRQYWIPALMSSELPERDGAPVRVRLMGENLIAFRVTSGKIGLIQNHCPHRGASLFFGRNEEEGLRCVYHGWKCSCEGHWFQGLEGDIDTSHLGFLHLGAVKPEQTKPGTFDYYNVTDRAPKYEVVDTEFGTSYGAYRPAEADSYYWRIAHFLFPFFTMIPTGVLGMQILVRAWVPVDDNHIMFWSINAPRSRTGNGAAGGASGLNAGGRPVAAAGLRAGGFEFLPDSSDWTGKFRLAQNKDNDYLIDREAQRTTSYTGIAGIHQQDQAVTESMGPIYDRSQEHLGTSDAMVIRTRRRVINAARALRDTATTPPGVDEPAVYRYRSGGVVLPRDADWLEATKGLRRAFAEAPSEKIAR